MFQSFDNPIDFSNSAARIGALRKLLRERGVDGFIVPRADEHQGEYIPPSAARLEWLTGFSGSAGVVVILGDKAAILVDGRYTLQVRQQVDLAVVTPLSSLETPLSAVLEAEGAGKTIAYDPWLHTVGEVRRLAEILQKVGGKLVAMADNPVDCIWNDRPAPPKGQAFVQDDALAGRSAADKLAEIRAAIIKHKADLTVLTDPSSVAWTFNLRGSDIAHNPLMLSFAIVPATGEAQLYVDPEKIDAALEAHLKPLVALRTPDRFESDLAKMAKQQIVALDPNLAAARLGEIAASAGGTVVDLADPAQRPRATKNAGELAGSRAAHQRDGVAMVKFLAWLVRQEPGTIDEITAAETLERCRVEAGEAAGMPLVDISFDTIAAAGPNGAIAHYRVNRESNRVLGPGELFLIDSGGQYRDGTTDITRTVPIGAPDTLMRTRFTQVLKGMIAISLARFPKGTRGVDLDPLARIALWKAGCDYAHGTGHGVGAFLAVHEGPQSISRRGMAVLEPGMIVSNEPGYYKEGVFGIRIENLLVVTEPAPIEAGDALMLGFETLTLAPIDRRLIDATLLGEDERQWLNAYHRRVREALSPHLSAQDATWLEAVTRPL
ncbi:aminopeptidase P family protein [Jiella sp. MQZ9-1]|uniref:Aminopeptidase P family protein n=1 Tax=Jiella flava TaxID=2816857 RepID=A0A939FZ80_9HYPH|nr:aminopeptidase P family protein [Jiella flava]MBO0663436.1 aminopeptidase P family protein [Jiella flava]MCD2472012.1 aminopeptidase P family protein [Jiella flava]